MTPNVPKISDFFDLAIENIKINRNSMHFCGDVSASILINGMTEAFIEFLEEDGLCRDEHSAWDIGLNDEVKQLIQKNLPDATPAALRRQIEDKVREDVLARLTEVLQKQG